MSQSESPGPGKYKIPSTFGMKSTKLNKSHFGFGISYSESKAFFKDYSTELKGKDTPGPGHYMNTKEDFNK